MVNIKRLGYNFRHFITFYNKLYIYSKEIKDLHGTEMKKTRQNASNIRRDNRKQC